MSDEKKMVELAMGIVQAVERAGQLEGEDFAGLIGETMNRMTFSDRTVLAMLRALDDRNFVEFVRFLPEACNKVAAERG